MKEVLDALRIAKERIERFELLLSADDDGFAFYGDNYGDVKVRHDDPSPLQVAEAIRLLQTSQVPS